MKTTLLIALLTLGLLPGLDQKAQAQSCSQQTHVFISGYQRCGTPIYKVRYIAGYDRCGRPIYRVRGLNSHERRRYYGGYSRSYHGYGNTHSYSGYGRSRISYTSSNGRNYSHSYYSAPSRCRSW